eukprot:snap_masked-scaffold_2-processed-gene-7.33-mRNA-1 protein AED:1.00 eAED:1.00 QI:0/-1/0/0/-1/1/1/0/64
MVVVLKFRNKFNRIEEMIRLNKTVQMNTVFYLSQVDNQPKNKKLIHVFTRKSLKHHWGEPELKS